MSQLARALDACQEVARLSLQVLFNLFIKSFNSNSHSYCNFNRSLLLEFEVSL